MSDLQAFSDKAMLQASTNTNKIVEDLFKQTVLGSPSPSNPGVFAKGLLVNQYYTEVGGGYSTDVGTATDDFGADSYFRIAETLAEQPFLNKDNVVTLANNTEEAYYADKLGWKAGLGTNGWVWTGNVGPYAMRTNAVNYIISKYK